MSTPSSPNKFPENRPTGRLRSTSGCITCRIRRVKCDEAKPSCDRCTSTGRKCDGYSGLPISRATKAPPTGKTSTRNISPAIRDSPDRQVRLPVFDDERQRQSFEFFVAKTCVVTPKYAGAEFWANRVLQLSISEPAIRYALCALSGLHRAFGAGQTGNPGPEGSASEASRTFSLHQYTLAVQHTQKLLAQSSTSAEDAIIKGLVVCVLFVCYENLVANYATAQMHLQNGLQIHAKYEKLSCGNTNRYSPVPLDIVQVLMRLDLQAMSFADGRAPYPYHSRTFDSTFPTFISVFPSLTEAGFYLVQLFRKIFILASISEPDPVSQSELDAASNALLQWNINFTSVLDTLSAESREKMLAVELVLKMYHTTMKIIIATGIYGHEMLNDLHTAQFSHIINLGKKLINLEQKMTMDLHFSFEIGFIFPLFFSAIKCRVPNVRREAIDLLASMKHQEGSWESAGAAAVSKFVMNVEEEGIEQCTMAEQIVETARVHQVNTLVHGDIHQIDLGCVLRQDLNNGAWYVREGRVSYERLI